MPKFAFSIFGVVECSSKQVAELYVGGLQEGLQHNKPEITHVRVRVFEAANLGETLDVLTDMKDISVEEAREQLALPPKAEDA